MFSPALALVALVASACAKTVVVTVGGNTTDNPMGVFQPASVVANQGDTVLFNCNHTATQSTFAGPCIPAHDTDQTINGFDSGFRDTDNGTAITQLRFTVTDPNNTIWFFDWNTCAQGGVGGMNVNESSFETLDGFQRNAIRLNGTDSGNSTDTSNATTSIPSTTSTSPSTTNTGSASSAANRALVNGAAAVVPVLAILAALSL
ncbi:hypothetical protein BJ912DRAFT_930640 [Pholiota molesta]|nr:hypothetical protein BJ912DRAFT_930640 [Pholiota molesta]